MIDVLLIHIRDLLNQYFKNQYGFSENKVVVSNLLENSGTSPVELEDRMVCFMLSLDEEYALKNKATRLPAQGMGYLDKATPLYLHLQLAFCANFKSKNYLEGLNYLSQTINFFHQNRILNPGSIPGMSKRVEKITFELCTLSYDNLSHIWSAIGSKILPAAFYKVGLVIFDDTPVKGIIPAITSTGSENVN
ncbi:DUF4255 domain-containing protein [Algoriphagus aestuariicola]|jgi:hypothetical protein|uniref:DUF4255 domain-containing protein n=1 Tax=Algoriphagus aestuariicola TaxID=1852016 RepID=A0ABS3BQ83_9BACT|nr:DUF4255 domain-containing protein [Algoriphagus aestuariicola]MBN7799829.1 DUF4255 domain-containing protein [Algoriphagus aestuariicola]